MKKPLVSETCFLKVSVIFENTAKAFIYLLSFLLPLFFLPWTTNVLEFNKQQLLLVFTAVAVLFCLTATFFKKNLEIKYSFLDIPILFLVFITGISTAFSLSLRSSFWGWPLSISDSFITLCSFVFLYFLIINLFGKEKEIFNLFIIFAISGFMVFIFLILQTFEIFIFSWDFSRDTLFNTIGTINSLLIFLAILLNLTANLIWPAKKGLRLILSFFFVIFLSALILVNLNTAWIVLLCGALSSFLFNSAFIKKTKKIGPALLPMFLTILAVFFLVFQIKPFHLQTASEVSLTFQTSLRIVREVFSGKNLFLGTGPGTFVYNYLKFKPLSINQTPFWNIRFFSSSAEIFDLLINTGILGGAAFLFLFLTFVWEGINYLKKTLNSKEKTNYFLTLAVFSALFSAFAAFFVYSFNLSLLLIFWILLAIFAVLKKPKIKSWNLRLNHSLTLAISFFLVFFLVFESGFLFLLFQRYRADIHYFQSKKAWLENKTDDALNLILKTVDFNPNIDIYWRDLSQIYLQKASQVLEGGEAFQDQGALIQFFISNAVLAATKATELEPFNADNWSTQGFIFRNLVGMQKDAEILSLEAYKKAEALDPNGPHIATEIGNIYFSEALLTEEAEKREEVLTRAKEYFERALWLKPDYTPALFQMALLFQLKGEINEAILKLEEAKTFSPFDEVIAFQLGFLYFNNGQIERAGEELERALNLALKEGQEDLTARYFLGLVYDQQKEKEKAIEQFEMILKSHPENQEIKRILENLKQGKPALEMISP